MRLGLSWGRGGGEGGGDGGGGGGGRNQDYMYPQFGYGERKLPNFFISWADLKARLPDLVVVEETHFIQLIQFTGRCPASPSCCSEETQRRRNSQNNNTRLSDPKRHHVLH